MLILREAAAAIRRTPLLSVLTALVIAISLAVIGIFALVSVRATQTLDAYRAKLPIEAYFDARIASDSAEVLSQKIARSFADVTSQKFISKEDALAEYGASSGEDLAGIVGYNPLPAGIRMTFADLSTRRANEIIALLRSSDGMKDILFDGKTLGSLEDKTKTLLTLAYVIGGFLLVVSIALAASLARLAMLARRETIRAMMLLGATRRTIVLPYYLEALAAGMTGGLIAAAAVISIHQFALPHIAPDLIMSGATTADAFSLAAASVVLGGVLGAAGSVMTSLKREYA